MQSFGIAPNAGVPILLKIDSQPIASKTCYPVEAYSFKADAEKIPNEIRLAVQKISENSTDLEGVLLKPADKKKAAAIVSKLGDKSALQTPFCIFFEDFALVPFKSSASKLRPDLMFAAFKKDAGGVWKWDMSLRTPAVLSLLESFNESGAKELGGENAPLEFIDISCGKNSGEPALKFYKFWQAKFYALDLPAYAEIMTPKSKEVYSAQYLSLTKERQKEILKDYITYSKNFYKIAVLDGLKVMLYTRLDKGKINSYDAAFLLENGDTFTLANFGQDQGKFADYLISIIKKQAAEEK
ncbi:MAG: hypothetical protein J6P03_01310 [Opitutales bacterium]|nr:hypothetical protein [Opitutales bacterium]